MELPRNFTGYDTGRLPFKSFQAFCFSLQGYGALNVLEVFDYDYPKNYYAALVSDRDNEFYILQNCFVPLTAFALKEADEFIFIDKPSIENAASNLCEVRRFLSRSELTANVETANLQQLSSNEMKEVKYWLPDTIGGVIFSWYFD
ncbi:hypothetical protein [Neptuniibacter sp. QD48_11]|uniref:hypothetical protein n=1 Tax=unclassified Neptuniibacter TaxID=2630693 RepID=UPI0039F53C6F